MKNFQANYPIAITLLLLYMSSYTMAQELHGEIQTTESNGKVCTIMPPVAPPLHSQAQVDQACIVGIPAGTIRQDNGMIRLTIPNAGISYADGLPSEVNGTPFANAICAWCKHERPHFYHPFSTDDLIMLARPILEKEERVGKLADAWRGWLPRVNSSLIGTWREQPRLRGAATFHVVVHTNGSISDITRRPGGCDLDNGFANSAEGFINQISYSDWMKFPKGSKVPFLHLLITLRNN